MTENDSFFNRLSHQEAWLGAPHSYDDFRRHLVQEKYSKELCYIEEIQKYKKGWDSYAGLPPLPESLQLGRRALSAFAERLERSGILNFSFPEFCLAPDGILGMEWDYAPGENLFARFCGGGKVECALTNGGQKKTEEMRGEGFINLCKELQEALPIWGKARPGHP